MEPKDEGNVSMPPPHTRPLPRHEPGTGPSTVPPQPVQAVAGGGLGKEALTIPQLRSKYMALKRELARTEFELVTVTHARRRACTETTSTTLTLTHTHWERRNKNRAKKSGRRNSSATAEQSWTSFFGRKRNRHSER